MSASPAVSNWGIKSVLLGFGSRIDRTGLGFSEGKKNPKDVSIFLV